MGTLSLGGGRAVQGDLERALSAAYPSTDACVSERSTEASPRQVAASREASGVADGAVGKSARVWGRAAAPALVLLLLFLIAVLCDIAVYSTVGSAIRLLSNDYQLGISPRHDLMENGPSRAEEEPATSDAPRTGAAAEETGAFASSTARALRRDSKRSELAANCLSNPRGCE